MIKILIKANMANLNGLSYHRLIVPYSKVSDLTNFKCDVLEDLDVLTDEMIKGYQYVVYQREIDVYGKSIEKIKRFQKLGCKVIFDIDDYWHLPTSHALCKVYKEYQIVKQTEDILKHVDIVTCTTQILADKIKPFNKNVKVYPNCLDLTDEQWQSNKEQSTYIRFGYIAGVHHVQDVKILQIPIRKARQINNAQFVLGGYSDNDHYKYYESVMKQGNYLRINAINVYEYGKAYNLTDVSLIPLEKNIFTEGKSEIKLLEAAAHGNAAIVSNVKPYNIFPKDTAIFLENSDINGWYKAIKRLTESSQMRQDYAEKLKEYTNINYNLNTWTEIRKQDLVLELA